MEQYADSQNEEVNISDGHRCENGVRFLYVVSGIIYGVNQKSRVFL